MCGNCRNAVKVAGLFYVMPVTYNNLVLHIVLERRTFP